MGHAFEPYLVQISGITNAWPAVVTTAINHNFSNGEYVAFRVTKDFGMREINNQRGLVLSNTSNTITVDINTRNYTPFTLVNLNAAGTTPPTCLPSSSGIIPSSNPPTMNLQDAFDNVRT